MEQASTTGDLLVPLCLLYSPCPQNYLGILTLL